MKAITVRLDEALLERVDVARGDVPRERWLRRAVEQELAGRERQPTEEFSWLAGFIDGEGCFMIAKSTGSLGAYRLQMMVRLRNDDRRVLHEFRELVGAGSVLTDIVRTDASVSANAKPQAMWAISSREGIARLIEILDEHPLRSKKARDYAIWREAAQIWLAAPKGTSADWEAIGVLCEKLAAVREYECDGLDAEQVSVDGQGSRVDVSVPEAVPAPAEQPLPFENDPMHMPVLRGSLRSTSAQAKRDVRAIPKGKP